MGYIVLRATRGEESGQIPIVASCLTSQEFPDVLIDLVTNRGAWLPFWHVT